MKRILALLMALILCLGLMPGMAAESGLPFTDVPANAWYYEDLEAAYATGLISGKTADRFEPKANMTYAEAVKLAACMHQQYTLGEITLENGSPWYRSYADYCLEQGIIQGDLNWDELASRAGYLEIFAKALPEVAFPQINTVSNNTIPDIPSSHRNAEAVYKFYRAGIMQGSDAAHNFMPEENITRMEVAAILGRMMNNEKRISFTMGTPPYAITVTTQPTDAEVQIGLPLRFSVGVIGGNGPYTFVWQVKSSSSDWTAVPGGDGNTITCYLSEEEAASNLEYRCVITDLYGDIAVSDTARALYQSQGLSITLQPQDTEISSGAAVELSVGANGGIAPYSYRWQKKTHFSDWSDVSGGSGATLTDRPGSTDLRNILQYRCIVSDTVGNSAVSEPAQVSQRNAPLSIVQQPELYPVRECGGFASFRITVSGGKAPYRYQWQVCPEPGGTDFYDLIHYDDDWAPGYLTPELLVEASEEVLDVGFRFRCIVTDAAGKSLTSDTVYLKEAFSGLTVTLHPKSCRRTIGDYLMLKTAARGGAEPYTYEWQMKTDYCDWTAIEDNTEADFGMRLTEKMLRADLKIRCVIRDSIGDTAISDAASITEMAPAYSITQHPLNQVAELSAGTSFRFTAAARGGIGPHSHIWQYRKRGGGAYQNFDGSEDWASGWDTKTLSIDSFDGAYGYEFRCLITDVRGITLTTEGAGLMKEPAELTIINQPKMVKVPLAGDHYVFAVEAAGGTGSYQYRWEFAMTSEDAYQTLDPSMGDVVAGFTESAITVQGPMEDFAVRYRCIITDEAGNSVVSQPVGFLR